MTEFGLQELLACSMWLIFPLYLLLVGRGKPARIKPKKITKIVPINSIDELNAARADVYVTPFGNVGQHIQYVGTDNLRDEVRATTDVVEQMQALHPINSPRNRLVPGYTRDDVGMERTDEGDRVVYRRKE